MKYINVPGIHNSGEGHWQTNWEQLFPDSFLRVHQERWDLPEKNSWVKGLNETIHSANGPVILVAHSLGCITVLHWALHYNTYAVQGALLVAPADVERSGKVKCHGFAPVPCVPLPFPAIVVASSNDPYAEISKASSWADNWAADFVDIGQEGHINAASGLGSWKQGFEILKYLSKHATDRPSAAGF